MLPFVNIDHVRLKSRRDLAKRNLLKPENVLPKKFLPCVLAPTGPALRKQSDLVAASFHFACDGEDIRLGASKAAERFVNEQKIHCDRLPPGVTVNSY